MSDRRGSAAAPNGSSPEEPPGGNRLHRGSCLCGGVAYEIRGVLGPSYYCHCSRCRKLSGSAFTSNGVVDPKDFFVIRGEDLLKAFPGDDGVERVFCATCGSPILVRQGDQMRLRLGGLDTASASPPTLHIHTASKADWFVIVDDLPQHAERPAD